MNNSLIICRKKRAERYRCSGRTHGILIFLCLAVLALDSSAYGTEPPPKRPIDQDILLGIELLYNSEFDTAEELFRKATLQFPKDPKGYFYLAMVTWSRLTYGFWTKEVEDEYSRRIDKTIKVARAKIAQDASDSFTHFYLGGALGFKGRFKLMQRKWASSLFLALDAIEALKTCKSSDPDNQDVLLGLGIFDYYSSRLSGLMKFFSYLLITREGKEEGLRKLHTAADGAIYSATEAKSVLLHIYLFMEDDYNNALPLARELAGRFANSHRYKYFEGLTYFKLNMNLEYERVLDDFQRMSRGAASRAIATLWGSQILYLEASRDLFHARFSQARDKLHSIIEQTDPLSDPAMAAWPLLKIGMSYDIAGEREKALKYYAQITEMENGAGAQFLAEKYTQEPAMEGDPFLGY